MAWHYSETKRFIESIQTTDTYTAFTYLSVFHSDEKAIDQIRVISRFAAADNNLLTYNFRYRRVQSTRTAYGIAKWNTYKADEIEVNDSTKRRFLTALDVVSHCANQPGYQFSYNSLPTDSNVWHYPPPGCCHQDLWGYYKPFTDNVSAPNYPAA